MSYVNLPTLFTCFLGFDVPTSSFIFIENVFIILVIRYIVKKNQSSKTDSNKLIVDVSYQFPVTFPFSYADVSYNDMKIPKRFKYLTRQLSNNNLFTSIKIKIVSNSRNLFSFSCHIRE